PPRSRGRVSIAQPYHVATSKNEPRSTTASTIARILYGLRTSWGIATKSQGSRRSASSVHGPRGGTSSIDDGRYARKRRAQAKASSSVSTAWSTAPAFSWISQPPSSFLVSFWPSRSTTGGPATNKADVSLIITE